MVLPLVIELNFKKSYNKVLNCILNFGKRKNLCKKFTPYKLFMYKILNYKLQRSILLTKFFLTIFSESVN